MVRISYSISSVSVLKGTMLGMIPFYLRHNMNSADRTGRVILSEQTLGPVAGGFTAQ